MSDAATPAHAGTTAAPATPKVSVIDLFVAFLIIGATSFGGGAVAYLRSTLVAKTKWLDDKSFLELFSISQSLPGLNTTNMAILAGDRLCGWMGAVAAVVGVILPGAIFMTIAGVLYGMHHDRPLVDAALKGVAAGATGLIFATFFQLAGKTMRGWWDLLFLGAAVLMVNRLHFSVLYALIILGIAATIIYYPGGAAARSRNQ